MVYRPIEDCGIIGDLHTVAPVARDRSIDFMCFPEFDSPTIFAALLDKDTGGRFQMDETSNGLRGKEGTFNMCSFWYVECLARSGDLHQALDYF